MSLFLEQSWLAVAVPLGVAFLLYLIGRVIGKASAWIAMLAPVSVLLTGVATATEVYGSHGASPGSPYVGALVAEGGRTWLVEGLGMGWAVDGLSAVMLIVVGTVALMVMLFSVGYMSEDPGYPRYFTFLSLFTAAMTGLVMADGLVGLFLSWELVGVCSYLLIGFWYHKPSASAAAMKAFLVTRVGDVGFLLGLALLWREAGTLDIAGVMASLPDLSQATITASALLLFMGAAGKSAQFPLHLWLPDAMEGPTPVSALIHAATMVAAGVFLVARMWPLFEASPAALDVILVLAVITAVGAATIALSQRDIKKVLAYSTISQLGFMFAALGAGAWRIAMFHLVTHAAFKALLFLGSGSVIHGTETQDMREMGGLARKMPITAVTWIIGVTALSGIPPLAGFFSKDEVVTMVLHDATWAGVLLVVASLLTAFYAFRATRLTFFGEYRGHHHPHESGATMALPLIILAVPAAGLGFFGHQIIEVMGGEAHSLDWTVASISIAVALTGAGGAWLLYSIGPERDERIAGSLGRLWTFSQEAYRYDDLVKRVVIDPTIGLTKVVYQALDRLVIDGLVEGLGSGARRLGAYFTRLQNGDGQWYSALIGAGVIVLIAISVWVVR
jgi:NADH-quinone oxidoreductase subunit L